MGYKMSDDTRKAVTLFAGYFNSHVTKQYKGWRLWYTVRRNDFTNDDTVRIIKESVRFAYNDLETQYHGLTVFLKNAVTDHPTTVKNYILSVLGWSDFMRRSPIAGTESFFERFVRAFDDSFADLFSVIT